MLKKVIWGLAVVFTLGYCAHTEIESRNAQEQKNEARRAAEARIDTNIAVLVEEHQANSDWEDKLTNYGDYRYDDVKTLELQKEWIENGPILFEGSIRDISMLDGDSYTINLNPLRFTAYHFFDADMELRLSCSKSMIDPLIEQHERLIKSWHGNGIAVIAEIGTIESRYRSDEEGDEVETKIGVGMCLEAIFTGRD
ncbi:MAG: hypothetical protein ACFHXK_09270 [bacterium]